MSARALVIVNPAAGGGRAGRDWPRAADRVRQAGLRYEAVITTRPDEATELARQAILEGCPLVVAAGGDGTLNEVANGFFEGEDRIASPTRIGILPMGTGGDFRRTLGVSADVGEAAAVLAAGHARRIDAGRVTCRQPGGGRVVRHFVNVADAGIGANVADRVNGGFKLINGEITFSVAAALTLLRWRNKLMRVAIDGAERDLVLQQIVVANSQYYGGGMQIAPGAVTDDGLLEVVLVGDVGRIETLGLMASVRKGTHLDHPKVEHLRARKVEVECSSAVGVDADGERPGALPAIFQVIPGALEMVAP
jgi:diacylglycerol kinase (ATP)